MKATRRASLTLLCILCLLAFAFAGCAAEAPPSEPVITPEASEPTPQVETLKVGMAGKDIKTACIIIAQGLGLYEEESLNVEFETISNLGEGLTAVDLGKLDILPFGVIPSATFIAQGSDVVIFGGTIAEGSEAVVLPERVAEFQTLADFRGKKVGCYRMETGHMVMKGLLREAGLDLEKDLEFVLLDSAQTIIEAVRKGEVDVGFLNSGGGYIARQSGLAVAFQVGNFSADFPCCRQTTSRATLENKRDALVRFQIANLRAYDIFRNDWPTALAVLAAYSGQPEEYVTAIMYGLDDYDAAMTISLDPNRNRVIEFYQLMIDNGDIDAATPYTMEDHIDISIYQEALEELLARGVNDALYQQLLSEFQANNF